jgi:hypothetical protein
MYPKGQANPDNHHLGKCSSTVIQVYENHITATEIDSLPIVKTSQVMLCSSVQIEFHSSYAVWPVASSAFNWW